MQTTILISAQIASPTSPYFFDPIPISFLGPLTMDDPEKKEDVFRRDSDIVAISDTYTAEEEKAVLRKIDMVILPFVSSHM
jgi:hypothetical protein